MGTWVNQPGHPLISAKLSGPFELSLSQRRFLLDGGPPDKEQAWAVPVSLRYGTSDGRVEHDQLLLQDTSTTVPLKGEPSWLLVNEEAWGVYRVSYSDDLWQRLLPVLGALSNRERLSLVSDLWATTVAGNVALEHAVQLWRSLKDDRDPDDRDDRDVPAELEKVRKLFPDFAEPHVPREQVLDHEQPDERPESRGDRPVRHDDREPDEEPRQPEDLPESVRSLPFAEVGHGGVEEPHYEQQEVGRERVGRKLGHSGASLTWFEVETRPIRDFPGAADCRARPGPLGRGPGSSEVRDGTGGFRTPRAGRSYLNGPPLARTRPSRTGW